MVASAIPVKSACVFQCSSFSWRAVKIARPFKRKQDLRVFKSISAALMDMMLSWPRHFDWLRQRWVHKSTHLPAFSVQLSKCLVFCNQHSHNYKLHSILRQILWERRFGTNGKCSVSSLSPATPALSWVKKFDLIFFPVLGYFPTEMKG